MYEIDDDNGYEYVRHPKMAIACGFDLTKFYGRDPFRELLNEHGLELEEVGEDEQRKFVWHGEDVLIVTAANPLTGEHPMRERNEPAYASYIGIEGERDAVIDVFSKIRDNSNWKDKCLKGREFI